jgi:6-phosphogluconolactonase
MKKRLLLFYLVSSFGLASGQPSNNSRYNLLIGSYTTSTNTDGIWVYEFNSQTGDFTYKSKISGVENPSYLAITKDGKHVYSVNEVRTGGVSAFSFNPVSGELTFINKVSSGGDSPCYVSVDDKNKYVFASNYGSGSLCAIPLKEDGSLSSDIQTIQQEGSSIDKSRQQGPHVHSTLITPDNRYLLTPNLGTDKVCIYKIDIDKISQPLSVAQPDFAPAKPGSGPRHITFHPNSKYVYLIHEMGSMITAFSYKNGKLEELQTITMLAPEFKGRVGAADIHVSPDGRFLYASNRGDANELVIYAIGKNGKLSYAGRQPTIGRTPRNFAIDPTGKFLLAANQGSNEVVIFSRDPKTGLLTATGKKIQVNRPVCLRFTALAK